VQRYALPAAHIAAVFQVWRRTGADRWDHTDTPTAWQGSDQRPAVAVAANGDAVVAVTSQVPTSPTATVRVARRRAHDPLWTDDGDVLGGVATTVAPIAAVQRDGTITIGALGGFRSSTLELTRRGPRDRAWGPLTTVEYGSLAVTAGGRTLLLARTPSGQVESRSRTANTPFGTQQALSPRGVPWSSPVAPGVAVAPLANLAVGFWLEPILRGPLAGIDRDVIRVWRG